jgi:osmotically-inducible protein OsmY
MALPRTKRKRQQERAKTAGGGGVAGLVALAGALLLWRRSRRNRSQTADLAFDDNTLAQKVKSEIFRDDSLPKGDINVNSEFGVVFLRGQVESDEQISKLETATREVDGVKDVRTLLHTAGTPTPAA